MTSPALTDLERIVPQKHPRYSRNLYLWIRKNFCGANAWPLQNVRVYARRADKMRPYIGCMDDLSWFFGSQLMGVLSYGSKEQMLAFDDKPPQEESFILQENFWPEYIRKGRCAIDPKHDIAFKDEATRWKTSGDTRTCLWCGTTQHLVIKRRIVTDEVWVDDRPANEIRLNAGERAVLTYLAERARYMDEGTHYYFSGISEDTGLSRETVQSACRALRRKGLAHFSTSLFNDDGETAGSGYAATSYGIAYINHQESGVAA